MISRPIHRVRTHLGGPRPRSVVQQYFDAYGTTAIAGKPGTYVIADEKTDRCIGTLVLDRRSPDLPGHINKGGGELELTYLLRRGSWGAGLAFEAATAVLRAAAAELPDQPVLVVFQTANERSLKLATRLGFAAWAPLKRITPSKPSPWPTCTRSRTGFRPLDTR